MKQLNNIHDIFNQSKLVYDKTKQYFIHNKRMISGPLHNKDIAVMYSTFEKLWLEVCKEYYKKTKLTPERINKINELCSEFNERSEQYAQQLFIARLESY